MTTWPKEPLIWYADGREHISVVFTYQLPWVRRYCQQTNLTRGYEHPPIVGGPAVKMMPEYLGGVAEIGADIPGMMQRHNPLAWQSTRGCVNRCGFCAIPKIEGEFRELPRSEWHPGPLICDNNLLAASRPHFDAVIDALKPFSGIDFNQGLDARLLTPHHASRIAELRLHRVRLAWDHIKTEGAVMDAIATLRQAGVPKSKVGCYVLIGFHDTPDDALYRLETLMRLGVQPNVMRYLPIDKTVRRYVDPTTPWTDDELIRYMRYWNNLRYVRSVPFAHFTNQIRKSNRGRTPLPCDILDA